MNSRYQHGFTLIELMLVIVIIGILSAGSWHGWYAWQQARQLNDSARQIQQLLLNVRSEAWWMNTDRVLWANAGQHWCLGAGPVSEHCISEARRMLSAPWPDVTLRALTPELGFYGLKNTARPGSILIGSDYGERRIIVSSRGRIRICEPAEEGCR